MVFNTFHCEPSFGGWFCKFLSSSRIDPRPYYGESIKMLGGDWYLMDDLTMLRVEVVKL